jgi:hypothetical protein
LKILACAYKGQATNLISTPDLLTAALQIHSVEARHASEVRRLRGLKGWITGKRDWYAEPHRLSTTEKSNHTSRFNTSLLFGAAAGSEAYDVTGAEATAIASLFIVA